MTKYVKKYDDGFYQLTLIRTKRSHFFLLVVALLSALNNNMVVVDCWDCFLLHTKKVLPYWLKMKGFVCLSHKSQRNVTSLFVSSCIVKRKPIEDPFA